MKDKSKIQNIIIIALMMVIIGLMIEPKINRTRILENNNETLAESSKITDSISQISDSLNLESKIQELKDMVLSFNNNDLGRYDMGENEFGWQIFDKKKGIIFWGIWQDTDEDGQVNSYWRYGKVSIQDGNLMPSKSTKKTLEY